MFVIINNDLNCHVLWSIRVNHHVCYHYYYCCHSDLLYCALSISDIVWLFQSNGFNMKHYSWPTVKRSSFPTRVNIQRSTKPTLYHNPFVQPILGDMLWVLLNLFFQKKLFLRKTQKYKDPSVNAKKKVPRDSRYIYLIMHITAKELLAYTCMTFDKIPSQTPQWIKVAVSQAQKTQS